MTTTRTPIFSKDSQNVYWTLEHIQWIVVPANSHSHKFLAEKVFKYQEKHWSCCGDENEKPVPKLLRHDVLLSPGGQNIMSLLQSNIVEMHLDSVFKTNVPLELFKCTNLQVLSLRFNSLVSLPAEIGRLSRLEKLLLTENCLTYSTIPFTLTFCHELTELYLDHNLLDALPGCLLEMPKLRTVYRHGNHNYFKSTFMWYHTAKRERVIPLRKNKDKEIREDCVYQPVSLESHSIRALIATKINFFTPGLLPATLQKFVAKVYMQYKICAFCSTAFDENKTGFRVFTFKSPYLGNTCVPFEHWTCSRECGVALEEPAQLLERVQARKMDKQYQDYITYVQNQLCKKPPDKLGTSCALM